MIDNAQLSSFLYSLMRNAATPAHMATIVEYAVLEAEKVTGPLFSNNPLAEYAGELANRLTRRTMATQLAKAERLRRVLRNLCNIPAVQQALGTDHTPGCECLYCEALALVGLPLAGTCCSCWDEQPSPSPCRARHDATHCEHWMGGRGDPRT